MRTVRFAHRIVTDAGMVYRPEDVAEIDDTLATRLLGAGYATLVTADGTPTTPGAGTPDAYGLPAEQVQSLIDKGHYANGFRVSDRVEALADPAGIVLTATNGTQYALAVSNTGALSATALTKPPINTKWPLFGLHTAGGPGSTELATTARRLGEYPALVPVYVDFTQGFPRALCDAVVAAGARPVITWEPMRAGVGATQPDYTLASIYGGAHNAAIDAFAGQMMETNYPESSKIIVRFAHEMNGTWYPWSEYANGNKPGDYVKAWRYVVNRVNSVGGYLKSDFLWCPNAPFDGSIPLAGLYPGADATTFVGIDAFNFGTTDAYSTWKSPSETLLPGLNALRAAAPGKTIIVAETGCVPSEGTKTQAAWASEMVRFIAQEQGDVMAFVWFGERKFDELSLGQTDPTDWRIDAARTTVAAMRAALAARRRDLTPP